jgi:predicted RNA-binding Zn-ribbon protein involved in translation (DUF1610 family)
MWKWKKNQSNEALQCSKCKNPIQINEEYLLFPKKGKTVQERYSGVRIHPRKMFCSNCGWKYITNKAKRELNNPVQPLVLLK